MLIGMSLADVVLLVQKGSYAGLFGAAGLILLAYLVSLHGAAGLIAGLFY